MKQGWEIKKLGEVCEIRPPKKEAKEKLKEQDLVSFLPMEDLGVLVKKISPRNVRPLKDVSGSYTYFADNDILLAKITPCFENGKLGIARGLTNGIGFGSSEYVVLRNRGLLIEEFLFYYLSREEFRQEGTRNMTGAVGHKRVSKEFIENYPIPLPPLPEQQRIVSILDEAFSAIERSRNNAEQNLKNARELFESYLQGVFENGNWEIRKLNDITQVKDGTHDSPKYIKEGIPFVTQKNIKPSGLTFEDTKFITVTDHNKFYKRSNVTNGDILISMIGANRGMAAIVDDKRTFSIKNVGLIKSSENINMSYLLYYLKSSLAMKYILYNSNGGAQEFVGLTALRSFPVPLPSKNEQQSIVRQLDVLRAETQKLETIYQQKLLNLEELKKSVLQKTINGESMSFS